MTLYGIRCDCMCVKHIINSVDGRPWTAEEEKLRQERLKRESKLAQPDKE